MNNQETREKLHQMRLYGMERAFTNSMSSGMRHDVTPDELVAHLVDAEWDDRYNRKLERLLSQAAFRYQAHLSQIDFRTERNLSKNDIMRFGECDWVRKGENIIITGATGVGKSFVASALGHAACVQGFKVLYTNSLKLFSQLKFAQADGSYFKEMDKIKRKDVVIFDDFGLKPLDAQARLILLELLEDRSGLKPVIIASQLPAKSWYDMLEDATIADAICDRLIHTAHKIDLKGESMRKEKHKKS